MNPLELIVILIGVFVVGYLLGFKWANWQWMDCAYKSMDMRIDGEYLFRVEYAGKERKVKI